MRVISCDVFVSGAGPAGASAARTAAKAGAKVVVAERRTTIGQPVRCAEYIPAMLVGQLDAGRDFIVQKIAGMRSFLHGEQIQELNNPGYVVNRDIFDQTIAYEAFSEGAEFLTGQMTLARTPEGSVLLESGDGTQTEIQARIILGADGPLSRVAGWMGLPRLALLPAIQVRMPLVRPLDHTLIFFDEALPAGYGWIFPKKNVANVGLGRIANGKPLAESLRDFIEAHRNLVQGEAADLCGGWIPRAPRKQFVLENMALVGDAAGHTHPITGAGIFQAVVGGSMAGRWAARAVQENNTGLLQGYADEWNDFFGDTLEHAMGRRQEWENWTGNLKDVIRRFWIGFREYYV